MRLIIASTILRLLLADQQFVAQGKIISPRFHFKVPCTYGTMYYIHYRAKGDFFLLAPSQHIYRVGLKLGYTFFGLKTGKPCSSIPMPCFFLIKKCNPTLDTPVIMSYFYYTSCTNKHRNFSL